MNMDKFVSKTFAEYLKGYRELTWREQLVLIYNSSYADYPTKVTALNTLIQEFGSDDMAARNIAIARSALQGDIDLVKENIALPKGCIIAAEVWYRKPYSKNYGVRFCDISEHVVVGLDKKWLIEEPKFKKGDSGYYHRESCDDVAYFSNVKDALDWLRYQRDFALKHAKEWEDEESWTRRHYKNGPSILSRLAFDVIELDSSNKAHFELSHDLEIIYSDVLWSPQEEGRDLFNGAVPEKSYICLEHGANRAFENGQFIKRNTANLGYPPQFEYGVNDWIPREDRYEWMLRLYKMGTIGHWTVNVPNNPALADKDDASGKDKKSKSDYVSVLEYMDSGGHQEWLRQAGYLSHEHYYSWEMESCEESELPENAVSLRMYSDYVRDKITFSKTGINKVVADYRLLASHRLYSELGKEKEPADRDVPPRLLELDVLPAIMTQEEIESWDKALLLLESPEHITTLEEGEINEQ